jgi:hypothetical protein
MRNKLLIILLLSVFQVVVFNNNILSAQKLKPSEVPSDVVETLEEQYSYVKVTGWTKEGQTYVASIKDGSTSGKVYLSGAGEWIRTLFTVPINELPSTITEYVKENYPEYLISVSALEEKEDVSTHYYLEVREDAVGSKPSVLTFSSTARTSCSPATIPKDSRIPG